MNQKHFLSISDLSAKEILDLFSVAKKLKSELKKTGKNASILDKKTLVMLFEKPSLRTRLSFETAMTQLGGHAVHFGPDDFGLGVRESISDVSGAASGMGELLMARTFKHKSIEKIAEYSIVPVINGLSDFEHPCQALSDFFTIWEAKNMLSELTIAFVGDGDNNIAHSLSLGCALLGITFKCASPKGYELNPEIVQKANMISLARAALARSICQMNNPQEAITGADVVYTDTWVSMGDESEKAVRLKVFAPFQVTTKLMKLAKYNAIFMHDMPIHRGQEATDDVIDGAQSVVFDQAHNRLHVQKALLIHLLASQGPPLQGKSL